MPAFEIDVHNVTNEQFLDFVDAGGYRQPEWWTPEAFAWVRHEGIEHPRFWARRDGAWKWRGMFEEIDLPPAWPVYVSQAEAAAYARWKGARLPTEAEYHRAAFGDPSGRRAAVSVGRCAAGRVARSLRLRVLESRRGRHGIPRARAPGACTT